MDNNPYQSPQGFDDVPRSRLRWIITLVVGCGIIAYLTYVVPLVAVRRLGLAWIGLPVFAGVGAVLLYLSPNVRDERRYKATMASRNAVDDEELFGRYFGPDEVAANIPGLVRQIIAKEMGYPAEKMLPDDDLMFYWAEVDGIYLIREIEEMFGVEISQADAEQTMMTIRGISGLVHKKVCRSSHSRA
jgi:hypothetical protein